MSAALSPWSLRATLLFLVCSALLALPSARAAAAATPDTAKTDCVYSAHSISTLNSFGAMTGRPISCAMVFVDATTTWDQWESPWIDHDSYADNNWDAWATAPGANRQLVITQDLFPSSLNNTDWLDAGAAGQFDSYDETLAQNLVNAGLGNSIIRLAPEMNGTWEPWSLGSTPAQWALWIQFWRNTVFAMRSVPGANFQFDWCVNDLYRNLPLSQIYPGNDVVDIIGMDVYDDGNLGSTGAARWNSVLNGNDGIQAIVNFAQAHGKPISFPEWGVDNSASGGGDDAAFVNGIAGIVSQYPTAYQSYFYKYGDAAQMAPGTQSLNAYISDFGLNGPASGLASSSGATAATASAATEPSPTTASTVTSTTPQSTTVSGLTPLPQPTSQPGGSPARSTGTTAAAPATTEKRPTGSSGPAAATARRGSTRSLRPQSHRRQPRAVRGRRRHSRPRRRHRGHR